MSCNFNGQRSKDEELAIMFSEAMDWQSVATNSSEEVVIYPVNGGHRSGSSQIKVKNIVDSAWDKSFHWGNLVATHFKGQYFAYALTVPGKSAGMVRVIRNGSTDRILLKGFRGFVRDLSFAFHEKRILVAAVDECGYLLVHEIVGSTAQLILQVNPDGVSTPSDCHRVVWCPYVPENPKSPDEANDGWRNDADDHALLLASSHDCRVEIWHLGHINGTVTYPTVTTGATQITSFDDAVVDIAFSPDSTALAVASLDGYVRFFLVNTKKEDPKSLHKWQPHEGKRLSGIIFLDNLSHPNIRECPLWKWAVTSAENNTEFKLWSCELWKCHQTIRFKSDDNTPIVQKMTLDLSASYLVISDIHRKALYVMHIEQEQDEKHTLFDDGGDESLKAEVPIVSKVSSITQLLLPFSAISVAIREASVRPPSQPMGDEDFDGDEKASKVVVKMLIVQPKSLQKCKAVFELGTSVPLGEGIGTSFSTINTTSEYEPVNVVKTAASTTNHINLLTPDAFVSPAKTNTDSQKQSLVTSPVTVSPLPPAPNEILALSSPRRPTPEVTSSTTPKRNGVPSGGSSPSREVEEILGTRPLTEGSIESPDTSSATVPTGPALQEALSAYPIALSPALVRTASANSKGSSPVMDKHNAPSVQEPLCTYPTSAVAAPPTPSSVSADLNGSLLELFKEALVVEPQASTAQATWPSVLPPLGIQPLQRPKEPAARETDAGSSAQLQMMQQSLDQLVQLVSAQRAEQQQLKNEIAELKSEMTRMQSPATVQPPWISQMESTLAVYFDRQLKKLDEINSPSKTQQSVSKLQSTIRSEFENKAHTLEQRSVDFIRKELQSVIATEMHKLEPVLKNTTLQLLTQLSQNKTIVDAYSQATSSAAVSAMNRGCKEAIASQLLPSLEGSFHSLFTQLHTTFSKGIAEFVRNIESNLERHRRLQDKESTAQLNATMDKIAVVLDQVRQSISTDTKTELKKISHEFPEKVRMLLTPVIQSEMQLAIKDQKLALDGALLAVHAAQIQSRAVTPAVVELTPAELQIQLKHMIHEGRLFEAFQRALYMNDLSMVMFVCARVDAQKLFSVSPCVFPPQILLALIQQLSADLGTSTELKLEYLQEAVMAVDFRDPMIKEHSPKVMPQLVANLQAQVASNPSGPLQRQLRLLLRCAVPLAKQE
ncbi:enhancer of mRNA-decapping protein 4-like isoform X1 [Daphnia carinata]|uniref:enhancer of mRNA-decapping protein 4-like isoform X1 n=1 Tax=Daphnia carinata TaxID=120202 RepID=UPI00257A8DE9|nr:enhancer of mRNA-decapping protein 4-like isoform X1 [Daphnia carinata]